MRQSMRHNKLPRIPREEYPRRWAMVQSLMAANGLDLLIAYADDHAAYGPAHARWLADFPVYFEPVCILFHKKSDPVMLSGPESDEYARLISPISQVRILKEFMHPDEDYKYTRIKGLAQVVSELGRVKSVKRIGLAGQYLMPSGILSAFKKALPSAQWLDVETAMCLLRSVKTPAELAVLKYAYKIAEAGMRAAIRAIKPGVMEREIAAAAESAMRQSGAEGTGIDTIVASGPNTRPILARSTFRKVQKHDLVLVTLTPRYEGYHGAIGRPVMVGNPGPAVKQAVKTAQLAQHNCARALRAGVDGSAIENIGRKTLEPAGLEKYFLYSGVHSVGVIEFEPPIFGPTNKGPLKKDMVISVDIPMFNTPWGGLRVEDGYRITAQGTELLNHIPYEIIK